MQRYKNLLIDAIPFIIVGALAIIVIGQFMDARSELETSRAQCYASAGEEACEK